MEHDFSKWIASLEPASDELIEAYKAQQASNAGPTNTYSRYVSERSVYRRGNTIYFQGAGTAGEVCARRTSLYSVAEEDVVSRSGTRNCNDNSDGYFQLTYRVAGLVEGVLDTQTDSEIRKLLKLVPSPSHSGSWPQDEGYVAYETLTRLGNFLQGRFATSVEDACSRTTDFSTMPDERSWQTPIEGVECEGQLILHAVLKVQ